MPFTNPILGGTSLVRPAIQSPNYVSGSTGWAVKSDGTAEFNSVTARGNIVAGSVSAGSIGSSTIVNSDFQSGTIETTTITFNNSGGLLLVYSTTSGSSTFTTGSGSFVVPAGVTSIKCECWGGGGSGGAPANFGGGGAGGGEYAAEYSLATTPGETLTYTVGAGSLTSANGGDTYVQRSGTDLVRAHGGTTANGTTGQLGGTGSTNSVHFNGGNGGNGATDASNNGSGGGGGSSAGPSMNGGNGGNATPGLSGSPGTGGTVSGGGSGGTGGKANTNAGVTGSAPGGGGGGAPTGPFGSGDGAAGKIVITYNSAQTLVGSISPVAGTDGFGNSYPEGIKFDNIQATKIIDANSNQFLPSNVAIGNFTPAGSIAINTTAYSSVTGVTVNHTKQYSGTRIAVTVKGAGFTSAVDNVFLGILVNGVDNAVTPYRFNAINDHRIFCGTIVISGLAAGTYSYQARVKVGSGTTTFTTGSSVDGWDIEVTEII